MLKDTVAATILTTRSESNNAPHNVRMNATTTATKWIKHLQDIDSTKNEKDFSFKKWFSNLQTNHSKEGNQGQWIFIACDSSHIKLLLPMYKVMVDNAFNSLIEQGIDVNRRVWFIFDELAKLKYMPALEENITLLRKYGGCIVAATQSLNQLISCYGKINGQIMLGQFNTNVIFRIAEVEEAQIIIKKIGEMEYLQNQKNTSYGANDIRDGISYTEQEKKQNLIKINDLGDLENLEAYILLPNKNVRISTNKFSLLKPTLNLQPAFIKKE